MLRRRTVEVDVDRVPGDRHGDPQLEEPVRSLERIGSLEPAVGKISECSTHDALRIRKELGHRLPDAIPSSSSAKLLDPALGERMRRELCAQVAAALVGIAHARDELLESLAVEPRRSNHHPFLGERRRSGGEAPGLGASDVGVMRA